MKKRINIFYTTTASIKDAKKIAKYLLINNFSTCVNVFPGIFSLYKENQKLCENKEVVLIIKTLLSKKQFFSNLKKIHNYEIPFISFIESHCLNHEYIKWAENQTFYSNS